MVIFVRCISWRISKRGEEIGKTKDQSATDDFLGL